MRDFAEDNYLIIHYSEEPTYFSTNSTFSPTTLDIAVTKNIPDIRNITTLNSDHDSVYLEIWTTNKQSTNWNKYRNKLDNYITINNIQSVEGLENETKTIIQNIQKA